MNTLRPSLTDLETLVGGQGELFSLRRWMREGKGRLWIPYGADQIAVLRGPVSCWMRLGVFELLSMPTSDTRRMWFFLDELDALGRIQGLKDAMVRTRKKGGCIVAGIQSIAQVRAVYGDAEAQTIVEQFATQLVLKCGVSEGGGTARFASELIGEREIERTETSNAFNRGPERAEHHTERPRACGAGGDAGRNHPASRSFRVFAGVWALGMDEGCLPTDRAGGEHQSIGADRPGEKHWLGGAERR